MSPGGAPIHANRGARRLIQLPEAGRQLLAAVAAQPLGAKLSIPRLRDALLNQADVLDALKALVDAGTLDRATLRPPLKVVREPCGRGHAADGEPAKPLFDALLTEGARRGLSIEAVSLAVWNNKARIYRLTSNPTVRRATAEKIRAWIADAPSVDPLPEDECPAPAAAVPDEAVTPHQLLGEIRAWCAEYGVAPSIFGKAAAGDPGLTHRLALSQTVRASTVEKIRAFLAGPPPELPDGRLRSERQAATIRRGIGREAEKRLNGEKVGRVASPAVRGAMQVIEDRRAAEHRQTDPVEQAKLALQRKGRSVYAADVAGGKPGHFHVSGKRHPDTGRLLELTPAALIAEAERVTGQSFRRVA